jgi:hypothetical protein
MAKRFAAFKRYPRPSIAGDVGAGARVVKASRASRARSGRPFARRRGPRSRDHVRMAGTRPLVVATLLAPALELATPRSRVAASEFSPVEAVRLRSRLVDRVVPSAEPTLLSLSPAGLSMGVEVRLDRSHYGSQGLVASDGGRTVGRPLAFRTMHRSSLETWCAMGPSQWPVSLERCRSLIECRPSPSENVTEHGGMLRAVAAADACGGSS